MDPAKGLTRVPQPLSTQAALDWYLAELNERLVVHWTGGAWRVPLSARHLPVLDADGRPLGRLICADDADVDRALSGLKPGAAPDAGELDAAMRPFAQLLARVRAREGFSGDGWDPDRAARALSAPITVQTPAVLLSSANRPVSEVIGHLAMLARHGAIWKPAPGAAASAHLAMRAIAPLAGASLALMQGDHATGRLLARRVPPLWAGRDPAPADPAS